MPLVLPVWDILKTGPIVKESQVHGIQLDGQSFTALSDDKIVIGRGVDLEVTYISVDAFKLFRLS